MTDRTDVEKMLESMHPMSQYKDTFIAHCKESGVRISTGILALDQKLNGGLANEFYIMAAATSTGKSAFSMSIAQAIAASGIDVLYFALEMGRDEFVARAISSISFEHHRKDNSARQFTAADILYWAWDKGTQDFTKLKYSTYEAYSNEYFDRFGKHLYIKEGGINGLTVKDIANIAALYKAKHSSQVVVFIDYLQLIKADPNDRAQTDRKTKMDIVAATLKSLASQIGMPVVAISSVGRKSYGGRVEESSLKESGDLEYTGGILLGWNWTGVTDAPNDNERQEEIQECRQRGYRKMALDILKNRNSERDATIRLKYYPAYNYFQEDDGFSPVTNDVHAPFNAEKRIIRA